MSRRRDTWQPNLSRRVRTGSKATQPEILRLRPGCFCRSSDPRAVMTAGIEGDPGRAMAGSMAALSVTVACLNDQEWEATAPIVGDESGRTSGDAVPLGRTGRTGADGGSDDSGAGGRIYDPWPGQGQSVDWTWGRYPARCPALLHHRPHSRQPRPHRHRRRCRCQPGQHRPGPLRRTHQRRTQHRRPPW